MEKSGTRSIAQAAAAANGDTKINNGGVTNGPGAVASPFVNVYSGHDQQHFAYLGPNGAIWDAYYCAGCGGGQWQLQPINCGPNSNCAIVIPNAMTDGPEAVSGPFVDTYTEHDQQHFAYRAANGDIWDAFYCPGCSGKKWRLQKINNGGVTSAPPAVSPPFVDVYSGHDQQHFSYQGENPLGLFPVPGELWDAFYCPDCSGNQWQPQAINCGPNSSCPRTIPNAVTAGPPAVSGPFVDTYTEHDQQHFAYLAANGEIWDAFYCPGCSGEKWRLQQLSGQ
jgi:hypothetical protein